LNFDLARVSLLGIEEGILKTSADSLLRLDGVVVFLLSNYADI